VSRASDEQYRPTFSFVFNSIPLVTVVVLITLILLVRTLLIRTLLPIMADLDPQQKIALINENLQEVLKPEIIENAIVKENRPLVIYWGRLPPPSSPLL
jgi:hypothetical protein